MSDEDYSDYHNPLGDVIEAMAAVAAGPAPQLARDEVNGLIVSTIRSIDKGYETAILDALGAYPVERYPDAEAALEGHGKWVELAPSLLAVTKLAYGVTQREELVELVRDPRPSL